MHFEYQNKTTRDRIRMGAHSFNPYVYFGHSWSYFDIQNLRLAILYILTFSVVMVIGMCPRLHHSIYML
jgi:hypothetical protein